MFISKDDYYSMCDRADELEGELKEIKERAKMLEDNEIKLLKENTELKKKHRQLVKLVECNAYNDLEIRIRKIKEVITSK